MEVCIMEPPQQLQNTTTTTKSNDTEGVTQGMHVPTTWTVTIHRQKIKSLYHVNSRNVQV
jgi:hypothetical protein